MMISRALAGFSAGVVFCTGLTLVVDSVPRKELGEWMSFALSGMTWGTMIAPTLGGIIYKRAGYYAVFLTLLIVVLLDFLLRLVMIETGEASKWQGAMKISSEIPQYGALNQHQSTFSSCSPSGVGNGSNAAAKSIGNPGMGVMSPESIQYNESPGARLDERQPLLGSPKPNSPWNQRRFPAMSALLSSQRLTAAVFGTFVYNSLIASFDDILSLFAHRNFGWDSELTGLLYLTIPVPSLISPFIGMLSDRYGARIIALCGFGLTAPCLALLSLIQNNSTEQVVALVILLVLLGGFFSSLFLSCNHIGRRELFIDLDRYWT